MNIISILKKDEDYSQINYPLIGWRLEPRVVPLRKSGVPTSPLDGVTIILIQY
jgi:hypothetical protein